MTDVPPGPTDLTGSVRRPARLADGRDPAPALRRCGYAPCGNELAYDGKGRPPEYCAPVTRSWPGGKTCKQMAAADRDGVRAAGLDAPLEEYTVTTDRLLAVAGPLAAQLSAVLTAVGEVRTGALTRVGEAERQMAEALDRAADADRAAQAARHAETRATAAAGAAQAETRATQLRMAETRTDAEARIAAATDRLAAVEREHGEAAARQQAAEDHQRAAERRARDAVADAGLVREQAAAAATEIAQLQHRVHAAETAHRLLTQRIEDQQQRLADLTELRQAATGREKDQAAVAAALRAENTALTGHLHDARVATAAAEARATAAEARYTELLTVLSDTAQRGATAEGTSPAT
ncbi:hypothetical protein [Actinoplanes awajinensis]|uniref:Response regulator receiver protein n=1 Tax=Actinoplanes awajinensis subsp. mycoplanecinus TaxID=135947 RepID=A0A101JQ09_9ACTN|nr:hypothetical protein [Actinoplanes awajinensis]KUL30870.1 hypothetical protein ADL15_23205 [Actinoplanes awajinensis subsp. mycoplanecinus]